MFVQTKAEGLSFEDLLKVAHRRNNEAGRFPYAVQTARCSNCRYCQEGKCSLKECCCMADRVKAHSCTFAEILHSCFVNVKDNVFHYRLRIASERATMEKSCFLDADHRKRFMEGISLIHRDDNTMLAQVYILSATESLWNNAKRCIFKDGTYFLDVSFHDFTGSDYLYYCIAYDFACGTSHADIADLTNDEVVDFDLFRLVCNAIVINTYGYDAVKISERFKKHKRKKTRHGVKKNG